jgi:dihydrolipoamide dehydrogenase
MEGRPLCLAAKMQLGRKYPLMDYDVVVIGGGPGGYKSALITARLGARVALVEGAAPGGNCLNYGCIPKKTLVHLAALLEDVNGLHGCGLVGELRGDFQAAQSHRDDVIHDFRDQFPACLRRLKIDLFTGWARLRSARCVQVRDAATGGQGLELRARRIILATGADPAILPACPADGRVVLTSRDFLGATHALPGSILCVGGGAVGVELAFILRQFGSRVTLLEHGSRLLDKPGIPERASGLLERKFERLGVRIRKGVGVRAARVDTDGATITFTDGDTERFERVLVAVGRRPHTEGLDLQRAGVTTTAAGFIATNGYLETTTPGIYAVGDVKAGPMTANAALHDAKVAAANALEGNRVRVNYHRVPIVIDSALEVAAVGLSEEHAENAGFEPDVARTSFRASPKARARNDSEGFIDIVYGEETGQLLGGCIVGPEAGEQIHVLTAACQSSRGLWFLKDLNYTHPSWCEELGNAVDPYTVSLTRSGRDLFRPGLYATPE